MPFLLTHVPHSTLFYTCFLSHKAHKQNEVEGSVGAHRKEEGEKDSKEVFSELNFHITRRLIIALQQFQEPFYTWYLPGYHSLYSDLSGLLTLEWQQQCLPSGICLLSLSRHRQTESIVSSTPAFFMLMWVQLCDQSTPWTQHPGCTKKQKLHQWRHSYVSPLAFWPFPYCGAIHLSTASLANGFMFLKSWHGFILHTWCLAQSQRYGGY